MCCGLVADAEQQLGAAVDGVLVRIVRELLARDLEDGGRFSLLQTRWTMGRVRGVRGRWAGGEERIGAREADREERAGANEGARTGGLTRVARRPRARATRRVS